MSQRPSESFAVFLFLITSLKFHTPIMYNYSTNIEAKPSELVAQVGQDWNLIMRDIKEMSVFAMEIMD
jgi:hypothetical protein